MKIRAFAVAALAAALAFGAGSTINSTPPEASASSEVIHFATAGDSLTINNTTENPMWWRQWDSTTILKTSPGGYAKSGYTSAQVLAAIPADIPNADVLVIMLGTNDVRLGVANSTTLANFKKIADKVGAPRVVLAATPPSNITTCAGTYSDCATGQFGLNRAMSTFAYQNGWLFVDPWFKMRQLDGNWTSKTYTYDYRHPTKAGSEVVKHRMEQAIRLAYEGTI